MDQKLIGGGCFPGGLASIHLSITDSEFSFIPEPKNHPMSICGCLWCDWETFMWLCVWLDVFFKCVYVMYSMFAVFQSLGCRSSLRSGRVSKMRWAHMVLLGRFAETWLTDYLVIWSSGHLTTSVQVRLLRAQLTQRDTSDSVEHPEEGTMENRMQSHLLELQRELTVWLSHTSCATVWSSPNCFSVCVYQGMPTGRAASLNSSWSSVNRKWPHWSRTWVFRIRQKLWLCMLHRLSNFSRVAHPHLL